MRGWPAPLAAAAFAAGILVSGAAGPSSAWGWGCLALGAAGLTAAGVTARSRSPDPAPLLIRAGLARPPPDPDVRSRVLAAARSGPGPREVRPRVRFAARSVVAALVSIALAGFGWSAVRASVPERSLLRTLAGSGVRVEAVMGSDPREGPFSWSASASVRSAASGDASWRAAETVWLQGRERAPPLEMGDRVTVSGSVSVPEAGGFGEYLRSKGIGATLRVHWIERTGPPSNPLLRAANAVRRTVRRALLALFPQIQAGLLLGLAIGDTSLLDAALEEDFRATGLGHLLAVSGSNVAMFLAPLLGLAVAARLRARGRFAVGVTGLVFFALLTRAEPSVMRASAMAGLTLLGVLLGRPRAAPTVLGAACLGLLIWDPGLIHATGFQLSVAATAGMVAFAGPLAERIPGPRALAVAAGATVGAQAVVTPLLLFEFHVVPTTTLPANLLAFPAVGPAMLFGLAAAAVWLVAPPVGAFLALIARAPLAWLIGVADRMASVPLPSLTSRGGVVPFVLSLAFVAWLAWRVHGPRRRARHSSPVRRALRLAAVGLVLPVFVWSHAVRAGPPSTLEVRFLDVGQGDAALIRSPAGATVLIDAGPERDVVATKLAAAGVHRLDVVVATHAHADHVAGFPAVLARFQVALVLEPGCESESPPYDAFLEAVRDEELRVRHPRAGEVIVAGDLRLEILGPLACHVGTASDANNDSIVLRLVAGEHSVLFTGDAEEPAQEELLEANPEALRADVYKVPHHGGGTSTPEFLTASGAELALVGVGDPNDYGHPVPWVMATLRAAGMEVWRTDLSGDVVVRFGPAGPYVESAA